MKHFQITQALITALSQIPFNKKAWVDDGFCRLNPQFKHLNRGDEVTFKYANSGMDGDWVEVIA